MNEFGKDVRNDPPLVVDLDGTLLNSDILVEMLIAVIRTNPVACAKAMAALRFGRAGFKAKLAEIAPIDVAQMPWNSELLALLRAEKTRGRRLYLASAATRVCVEAVANHFQLFDGIFASSDSVNLKGAAKADVLCRAFGRGGYDYAGNDKADMFVWHSARHVLLVNTGPRLRQRARSRWPQMTVMGGDEGASAWSMIKLAVRRSFKRR
jgi:phosphoserine phosphatase